ncbi:MAG: putative selenium-dependent hydroxylase accessory protein YqeC [Anaerolineaceae bacterium]|nr:putative selenium-dependent hydroxylase accessory protein YqeC [Anaerolineaceae bacterium]
MDLQRAFGLQPGESVALTGAGGKTSLMFALADSFVGPVILTTTTHLGAWQAPLAKKHLILQPGEELSHDFCKSAQKVLVTGPVSADDRLSAMEPRQLEALREYCRNNDIPLLIEADGARQRNLKAPADHEPVVPEWVDQVIVVAGLAGLDQPLDETTVHRPERFAALSGSDLGEPISCEALIAVLGNGEGGLKDIPPNAKRTLFLNQADTPKLQSQAGRIASELKDCYSQVVIGSLQQPGEDGPIFSVHSKVAGVILAAGSSQRLGRPKQLLDWQGQAFIAKVAQNALDAGLTPLIVVTGAESEAVSAALTDLPVTLMHNPDWEVGQSTSLKKGVQALPEDCQAAVFMMSDQPQVSPILIRSVVETYYAQRLPIAAPRIADRRANPVLFAREAFNALKAIQGDQGGRAVLRQFDVAWLGWTDERDGLDVDDEAAYARLKRAYFPDPARGTSFHDFLTGDSPETARM